MVMPPLTSDEAKTFICDVLKHFRDKSNPQVHPFFPFTEHAIETIVEIVRSKTELKPRSILQACNAVLEEADPRIEEGAVSVIEHDLVQELLQERTFLDIDEER